MKYSSETLLEMSKQIKKNLSLIDSYITPLKL